MDGTQPGAGSQPSWTRGVPETASPHATGTYSRIGAAEPVPLQNTSTGRFRWLDGRVLTQYVLYFSAEARRADGAG